MGHRIDYAQARGLVPGRRIIFREDFGLFPNREGANEGLHDGQNYELVDVALFPLGYCSNNREAQSDPVSGSPFAKLEVRVGPRTLWLDSSWFSAG
jgi:hypothetical protein